MMCELDKVILLARTCIDGMELLDVLTKFWQS